MRSRRLVALLLLGFGLLGTAAPARAAAADTPRDLPMAAWPYHDWAREPRRLVGVVDGTGVRMFKPAGGGPVTNHPVAQAQYGLTLLNTYRQTRDPWFLNLAARQGQRLVDTHIESRGAWWFPYPFDFELGSNLGHTMRAPWYSAMAQGQAVSLFARLALVTGQSRWRDAADGAFAALGLGYSATEPWGTWTDEHGMFWLEEYPGHAMSTSGRVLNGHMFAMFGLWDYWRLTRSSAAASLFRAASQTVRRYVLNGFRNPGWSSSYGLRGDKPSNRYHAIHINQLLHMQALTGDPVYATMAETLHYDFSDPAQVSTLRFKAGAHTGILFPSPDGGAITGRRRIELNHTSSAPVDQRRRIWGQPGYWYRVTAGSLAGYWVQEVPRVRATPGPVGAVSYVGTRTVRLRAGSYTAYTAKRAKTLRLIRVSAAPVSAIGWINGRVAVAVSAGRLRGYWLPLRAGVSLR